MNCVSCLLMTPEDQILFPRGGGEAFSCVHLLVGGISVKLGWRTGHDAETDSGLSLFIHPKPP